MSKLGKNDFATENEDLPRSYSGRFGALLSGALFLTGFCALGGLITLIYYAVEGAYGLTAVQVGARVLRELCLIVSLAGLVSIALHEGRPFTRVLVRCVGLIGGMIAVSSAVFPRLSGYAPSGISIFSSGDFVLIDGAQLLAGLLLLVLAGLLKEGTHLQRELDDVI